jgi:hypothetical protein
VGGGWWVVKRTRRPSPNEPNTLGAKRTRWGLGWPAPRRWVSALVEAGSPNESGTGAKRSQWGTGRAGPRGPGGWGPFLRSTGVRLVPRTNPAPRARNEPDGALGSLGGDRRVAGLQGATTGFRREPAPGALGAKRSQWGPGKSGPRDPGGWGVGFGIPGNRLVPRTNPTPSVRNEPGGVLGDLRRGGGLRHSSAGSPRTNPAPDLSNFVRQRAATGPGRTSPNEPSTAVGPAHPLQTGGGRT